MATTEYGSGKENSSLSVKHGGGNVRVPGVGNLDFIESTMKKEDYLKILRKYFLPSVGKLSLKDGLIFPKDNDPKHTAYILRIGLNKSVTNPLHTAHNHLTS